MRTTLILLGIISQSKTTRSERTIALSIAAFLLLILAFATSCKKEVLPPQQFHKGDKVRLVGFNPRKSFIPYDCCDCPCIIDSAYTLDEYPFNWWYNLHDPHGQKDSSLVHVVDNQLKRW